MVATIRWVHTSRSRDPFSGRSGLRHISASQIIHQLGGSAKVSPAGDGEGRCGFTLIEMMVVISLLTVIISLVGMTFHLLLRTEKGVSQSFVTERAISRLAIQFRDDVHRAATGIAIDDHVKLELELGDASGIRIRYAVTAEGVARLLVAQQTIVAREDFRLPECRVSVSVEDGGDSSLCIVVIERPGATLVQVQQNHRPLRPLRIEAQLNRQRRLAGEVTSTLLDGETTSNSGTTEVQK